MNEARSNAYGRVRKILEDLGPAKLQHDEQELIRAAADALLFDEDGYDRLSEVEDLLERLVESGRWTQELARQLVDDLAACGSRSGVR
jgi:hypothetical protein